MLKEETELQVLLIPPPLSEAVLLMCVHVSLTQSPKIVFYPDLDILFIVFGHHPYGEGPIRKAYI